MRTARRKVPGAWADGPYIRLTAFRRNGLREIEVFLWRGPSGQVVMYARYTNVQELAGRPGVVVVSEGDFEQNELPGELQAWHCRYGKNRLEINSNPPLVPGEHPFDALRRREARYLAAELDETGETGVSGVDFAEIEAFLANKGRQ
jgi:hypothetical protein